MRSSGKSDFARLVRYITDAQNKTERLGQVQITNCEAGSIQDAMMEILATQHLNTRATGDKTYHLLVSFPTGEHPENSVLQDIEERLCTGLGYGAHQRISALHHDTDHLHIHIALNKIHPTRHTMHEPFLAYKRLGELCANLEEEHGLQQENHTVKHRVSENRALDMEKHSGVESLVGWIQRTCLNNLLSAPSWRDLHEVFGKNGLELRVCANGLIIKAGGGPMVKASTVARALSRQNLERRLGPFEALLEEKGQTETQQYQQEPLRLRVNTEALYAKYKIEQQTLGEEGSIALKKLQQRKERESEAAKRANRLRRTTIKLIGKGRFNKKLLYTQASRALIRELQRIHEATQKERQDFYRKRCTWADWLQRQALQGNGEALSALRARGAQGLKGNTLWGEGQPQQGPAPVIDTITKKGTIIFRAGRSAVRDDGERLQVSREATREGLEAALRLARERYGNCITVNGTALFKAQILRAAVESHQPITFADPLLERRRQDIQCTIQWSLLIKENTHGSKYDRGRAGQSSGSSGSSPVKPCDVASSLSRNDGSFLITQKPHIKRPRQIPPPQSRHCLRTLSQLDVVCFSERSEVLLPHHVSHHVEQQGAKPNYPLRWSSFGPGMKSVEREEKRLKDIDIPKNFKYTACDEPLPFAGTRGDSVSGTSKGSIRPSKRRR